MAEVQQQQELRDVLQGAQTALEEGRLQEAIAACQHALRHYPDAITALRLLGEAYLEAGRSDDAARAFDKALALDPQNVLARVGLGVIAEDRGEDERAIAQFRLAWEIEPTLPQLRGELVRLYRKRYGAGGRLRLSRVALANLHKRNDDLLRAIGHLRQLHGEDPNRVEVILSLAEALWRHDEDDDAAMLCQYLLTERPRTARALLILASIRGDAGAADQGVDELLAAARGFDPDLTLTGEMIAQRPSETLLAFAGDVPTVPAFDPATAPAEGSDELLSQGVGGVATPQMRWEDIASGLSGETISIRSATTLGVVGGGSVPTAAAPAVDEVDQLFAAIDRELSLANEHGTGSLSDAFPFELPPAEAEAAPAEPEPAEDLMMPAPDEPSAVERLTANWDNIDNELAAARPSDDIPKGMTGMLSALGDIDVDLTPFDVDKASQEEEQTLTFDPAKFSLPPLDGEEDEDDTLAIEGAALEDDVAPFSLESAGVRTKTGGISFADIVSAPESPLPTTTALGPAAPDESTAVADAASIFQTRELSSLPADELLEVQVAAATPDTDALADTRVLVPGTAPIADEVVAAPDAAPPAERDADLPVADAAAGPVAEAVAEPVAAEAPRAASSTADLDKLLSTGAPRLAEAPATDNYPVDATRPLLADEALLLGVAAAPPAAEDRLVASVAPAPPAPASEEDEVGMDKLFNRLRHRKQERIQTGDLLVNRRLQAPAPGADTGEIAGPLPAPKKRGQRFPAAASPDAAAVETAATVAEDPAAGEEPVAGTADFLAAIEAEAAALGDAAPPAAADTDEVMVDDGWLTALVGDAPEGDGDDHTRRGEYPAAPPAASNGVAAHTAAPVAHEDDGPVGGWAALLGGAASDEAPEQPAPPAAWASPGVPEEAPHWGDEALAAADAAGAIVAAAATAAPRAGGTPAVRAPSRPLVAPRLPQESVVMRVRTTDESHAATRTGSRPLTGPVVGRAARPAPRQTEQLARLSALVESQPENHFARLTLAVAYVSGRQPELALNEYRRLIKDADELVPEVVERLKELIADGDAPPRTHRVLGDAYMKLDQFDLAMAEFQRALAARPRAAR